MSFSLIKTNTRFTILFTILFFSFILITITLFDRQYSRSFQHTRVSYQLTKRNHLNNDQYVPLIHQPLSSSLLRGILIFYPTDQEEHYLPELLWLFRSWIEMMKDESSLWRTDLVVYADDYSLNLQQLGCVHNRIRVNRQEAPQCRVFPYKRVRSRSVENDIHPEHSLYQQFDSHRSLLLTKYLSKYDYLDSINVIGECYPSFAMYDYILRTDVDVFLTKNFGRFAPYNDTLLIGQGGYAAAFSNARLRRIAKDMGWLHANLTNIGSTWYGPPQVAQRIANFTLEAMIYLTMNEFTISEREGRMGTLLWPEWHFGVLSMYGTHLAINHLILSEELHINKANELLDQFSSNKDPYDLEKNNRLHLHCWHTLEPFSKFRFKAGQYNNLNPDLYLNDTSASGYCMRMALESRIMSFAGLKEALLRAKDSSRL